MNQPLLSLDSIQRIRQYVELKFSHLPKDKHAEIVADAIAKVVEQQLPSFENDTKKTITYDIIKHIVIQQKRSVLLGDVVQACELHPLSEKEKESFIDWRHQYTPQVEETAIHNEQASVQDEVAAAAEITLSVHQKDEKKRKKLSLYYTFAFILLFSVIIVISQLSLIKQNSNHTLSAEEAITELTISQYPTDNLPHNELPGYLQFTEFDKDIIKSYLNTRNSILVEEPYFETIYNTAYEFNIHPVLLFSITGQEQGFVPRDHEFANDIAQNPFNVFYSWQDYNTTIKDTTAIAARTLINLSKERPTEIDAIKWINRKYAEDQNWHIGVSWFFNTIVNHQIEK